jgi:mono/diheme cytochrome c family protein
MKSMYVKIVVSILVVGLLAACGAPPTEAPASTPAPTEAVVSTTAAPTEPPAATEAPTEAAAATQPAVAGEMVSFSADVLPIFESRCIGCHGGERTQEGLDLKTHASLMAGSNNGFVVTPGDAADSLLVELVANQKMPKRGPKLTPPQVELITDWVNLGAPDN